MEPSRGPNSRPQEPTEPLGDVFKAAALTLTKLYKTSFLRETRALNEGYIKCLQDLLGYLDKENLGLDDGEGWKIRAWAMTALSKRDSSVPPAESEDEVERNERMASPEAAQTNTEPQNAVQPTQRHAVSPTPNITPLPAPSRIVPPTQDTFAFQSSYPYPNIATLDLSDSRHDGGTVSTPRTSRGRLSRDKNGSRTSGHLGRGAGSKRRWEFDELFGGYLGGKDPFGGTGKRSRHT